MTIKDSKIYKKQSNYSGDIIATIRNGKVYNGTSTYSGDIKFSINEIVTIEEFVAIWYVVKYIW